MITQQEVYFFRAFGFLKFKNVFRKSELVSLKTWFDSNYEKFFNCSMKQILMNSILKHKSHIIPSFADNDERIFSLLYEKKLFDLATALLGPTMQYWGSDGCLISHHTHWHRDVATIAKRCKFNLYLNSGSANSGAFRIIPGSHKITDNYSNMLGHAVAWPEPDPLGGLNESGLLPETRSPKHSILANLFRKHSLPDIPHHIIEFSEGDLLVFDDRAIHCVYAPIIPKPRRLITLLFTEYYDRQPTTSSNTFNFSMESINDEVIQLKQWECDHYSIPTYPSNFINVLQTKGKLNHIRKLAYLKPRSDGKQEEKGAYNPQSSDFKIFLRKNYRDPKTDL